MEIDEARPATLIPLIASAIAIILIGVFNSQIVEIIEQTIPATGEGNAIPSQAITGGVAAK